MGYTVKIKFSDDEELTIKKATDYGFKGDNSYVIKNGYNILFNKDRERIS